jgi:hypothetical protein
LPLSHVPAKGNLRAFIILLLSVFKVLQDHQSQLHLHAQYVVLLVQPRATSKFSQSCSVGTCRSVGHGQLAVEVVVFEKFHHTGFLHSADKVDHVYNFHQILSTQYVELKEFSFAV